MNLLEVLDQYQWALITPGARASADQLLVDAGVPSELHEPIRACFDDNGRALDSSGELATYKF